MIKFAQENLKIFLKAYDEGMRKLAKKLYVKEKLWGILKRSEKCKKQ